MNDLKNKNIIVTGASGGIGNSIVKKLYEYEANVLASGTRIEKLEELKKIYNNIKILNFDISKSDKIEGFIDKATDALGGSLDCMINNAGVTQDNLAIRMSIDELKELLIKQIENRVKWRETIINMINGGVNQFIEIGPGKVLSGLVKRINKDVKINSINNESDIESLKI